MSQVTSEGSTRHADASLRPSLTPRYLLAFAAIGITLSVGGPALSFLRDRAGTNDGGIATVFVGQSTGYVIAGMLAGKLLDRGHGHRAWIGSIVGMLGGLSVVAAAHSLLWMIVGFTIAGASAAVGDVCGNTLTMWNSGPTSGRQLGALHLCFALGAIVAPLAVARSLAWTSSLWLALVPIVVLAALVVPALHTVVAPLHPAAHSDDAELRPSRPPLALAAACAFFFLYVALEVGFAGWIHTYVERVEPGAAAVATGINVTFLVGFAAGRLGAVWLADRLRPVVLAGLATAMSLATTAGFVLWRGRGGPWLWVIAFLFAVSVAPQYASMVAYSQQRLSLHGSDTSWIVGISGLGGLLAPFVIGQLFDAYGSNSLPWTVLVLAVATAVSFTVVIGRFSDRR